MFFLPQGRRLGLHLPAHFIHFFFEFAQEGIDVGLLGLLLVPLEARDVLHAILRSLHDLLRKPRIDSVGLWPSAAAAAAGLWLLGCGLGCGPCWDCRRGRHAFINFFNIAVIF